MLKHLPIKHAAVFSWTGGSISFSLTLFSFLQTKGVEFFEDSDNKMDDKMTNCTYDQSQNRKCSMVWWIG